MGYYRERTAIFMGIMDWVMIALCLGAAVLGAFLGGAGLILTLGGPVVALLIWWACVSPTTPRPQQGPRD